MVKYKVKSKWKSIVAIVLVIGALIAVCAGLAVLSKKETKTISRWSFERGSIDENGDYIDDNTSIFTKDMFECMNLSVEADVRFKHEYQVFYYNFDGVYLSCSDRYLKTTRLEIPELAKYARVVIFTDEEIGYFETAKIAQLLDIKVAKKQNFALYDYFKIDEDNIDKVVTYNNKSNQIEYGDYLTWGGTSESSASMLATGWAPIVPIKVTGWNNLYLSFNNAEDSENVIYFFTTGSGDSEVIVPANSVQKRINGGLTEIIIEVPDGANTFYANGLVNEKHHYVINQYN